MNYKIRFGYYFIYLLFLSPCLSALDELSVLHHLCLIRVGYYIVLNYYIYLVN